MKFNIFVNLTIKIKKGILVKLVNIFDEWKCEWQRKEKPKKQNVTNILIMFK